MKVERVRVVIELVLEALRVGRGPLKLSIDAGEVLVVRDREVERRARARERRSREEGDVR